LAQAVPTFDRLAQAVQFPRLDPCLGLVVPESRQRGFVFQFVDACLLAGQVKAAP
jgi:hypothetical protein